MKLTEEQKSVLYNVVNGVRSGEKCLKHLSESKGKIATIKEDLTLLLPTNCIEKTINLVLVCDKPNKKIVDIGLQDSKLIHSKKYSKCLV